MDVRQTAYVVDNCIGCFYVRKRHFKDSQNHQKHSQNEPRSLAILEIKYNLLYYHTRGNIHTTKENICTEMQGGS